MFERQIYKKQAREQLKHRWTHPILIEFILVGAIMGASMIFSVMVLVTTVFSQTGNLPYGMQNVDPVDAVAMLKSFFPVYIIGMLLYTALYGIVTLALHYFYMAFSKDNNATRINTFFRGLSFWTKGITSFFWWSLWMFLWVLPFAIPFFASWLGMIFDNSFLALEQRLDASFWIFFAMCILFYVPIFVKGIDYSQMFFIIAENPTISVRKAMKMSIAMTRGYKWKFFVMLLSFLGWFYLSALTLYILLLWLIPYVFTSFAYAYQYMKQNAIDRKVLTAADFGQEETFIAIEKTSAEETPV